ncbi:MAG: sugar transferase [Terracidiphilus sp.]|jgi:exopolysaccharide biosynthesis polyprenyl glycosylphosphotransferase
MATSDFWQRVSSSVSASANGPNARAEKPGHPVFGRDSFWIVLDVLTILGAVALATVYRFHTTPMAGARGVLRGTLIHGRSLGILLILLCGYTLALVLTSRRFHLYTPMRIASILHEQRLSAQACLYSGLLLAGTLYLIHAEDISRTLVLITVGLVTVALGLRRLAYRLIIYRQFEAGVGTRNVLIIGVGAEAQALRHHLNSIRHLGYTFKGFIDLPGSGSQIASTSGEVVGKLDSLFQITRKLFVDEIFFTTQCDREIVHDVLDQAQFHGVDLRVVPGMYDGHAWNSPIEYIGQFPTIPLHRGHVPEMGLLLKRAMDLVLGAMAMIAFSPLLLAIAIAIKLDSPGPILYFSERLGKKGIVFRCIKFRTMVRDAEKRRADVLHMNERDGVLFKMTNDPRITKVGRFLRKYSLDELPQFLNVLRGEMSIVGPRPPLASEVREYKLSHLRRLDVMPGITGLWQVQARRDPSFDNYISLDTTYVDNWSIWLDLKILARTVGVVIAGTGS